MCCTAQLNNEDFPIPTRAGSSLGSISSCWFGRILLALRTPSEKLCGYSLIFWDILLSCSWNCSETPWQQFQRLFPSPLCDTHSSLCTQIMQSKKLRLMLIISLFEAKEALNSQQRKICVFPSSPRLDRGHISQQLPPWVYFWENTG